MFKFQFYFTPFRSEVEKSRILPVDITSISIKKLPVSFAKKSEINFLPAITCLFEL